MAPIEYRVEDVVALMIDLLRANGIRQGVHLRPSLFVAGEGSIQARGPVALGIVAVPAGTVVDTGGWDSRPFRLAVSSWRRIEDNTTPPRIKCAANYQNARLALLQAETDGYDGALMLDSRGHVTEEARACLFAARGAPGRDAARDQRYPREHHARDGHRPPARGPRRGGGGAGC